MSSLTAKQVRFVAEYLVDANGSRAARAAGYGVAGARVAAHRLLTNANVKAEIEARQGVDATRLGTRRQDVIAGLQEAFRMARDRGEPGVMVSASRELGRMVGLYPAEGRRVSVSRPVPDDVRLMSDAELEAQLAQHW
jgi:hypothetical protein